MKPVLQPAMDEMAAFAAPLIQQTMNRMADYLFGMGKAVKAFEYLFQQRSNRLSHQYTDIVSFQEKPAGIVISYPGRLLTTLDLTMALQLFRHLGLSGIIPLAVRTLPLVTAKEAEGDEYYISNLAVVPDQQGKGLGTYLLSEVGKKAAAQGFDKISLTVDVDNEGAVSLYERTGFEIVEKEENRFLLKRIGYSGFYRMRKRL